MKQKRFFDVDRLVKKKKKDNFLKRIRHATERYSQRSFVLSSSGQNRSERNFSLITQMQYTGSLTIGKSLHISIFMLI